MKRNPLFWGLQTILILAAMIKILSGIPRGISEAGIILVVVYALFVRYQLRVLLARKWTVFLDRASAPYLGAFLVLIPVCLLALVSGHNPTAEFSAMLGYYLLLVGIFIEFLDFAKNSAKNL
jgi:predicted PurR-regulated permease PerM